MPTRWSKPVEVDVDLNGSLVVNGPFEALAVLSDKWPNSRGLGYVNARSVCRAAVAGRKDPEEARAIFISAAKEAEIIH